MKIFHVVSIIEGQLLCEPKWPKRSAFRLQHIIGVLTGVGPVPDPADIEWRIDVTISDGPNAQTIPMSVEPFLSKGEEYDPVQRTLAGRFFFRAIRAVGTEGSEFITVRQGSFRGSLRAWGAQDCP